MFFRTSPSPEVQQYLTPKPNLYSGPNWETERECIRRNLPDWSVCGVIIVIILQRPWWGVWWYELLYDGTNVYCGYTDVVQSPVLTARRYKRPVCSDNVLTNGVGLVLIDLLYKLMLSDILFLFSGRKAFIWSDLKRPGSELRGSFQCTKSEL